MRAISHSVFFLLSDSATFNEDDANFQSFFEKRFHSIHELSDDTDTNEVFRATAQWLINEVFTQHERRKKTQMEIEQGKYEKDFAQDIKDAIAAKYAAQQHDG